MVFVSALVSTSLFEVEFIFLFPVCGYSAHVEWTGRRNRTIASSIAMDVMKLRKASPLHCGGNFYDAEHRRMQGIVIAKAGLMLITGLAEDRLEPIA